MQTTMLRSASVLFLCLSVFACVAPGGVAHAEDPLNVVTTIPDLAHLAREIGGDAVRVTSLTSGDEDFHAVRPRPKLLVALSRAELLLTMGLDLEHAWLPALLRSARNDDVKPGTPGFVNASAGIEPLDVPEDKTRAAGGDNHPMGNPHYNLSPRRMKIAAGNILAGLIAVRPESREAFEARHTAFIARLDAKIAEWERRLAPLKGGALLEDHRSWSYFADEFGLRIVGQLEPRPGVDPSPRHLAEVIETARAEEVRCIVCRPVRVPLARKVAEGLPVRVVPLDLSSRRDEEGGYIGFIDRVVAAFLGEDPR